MGTVNLAELLRPYARKWVALSWEQDQVLASGASLSKVAASVKRRGYRKPVFTFVSDPRYGLLPGMG